MVIEGFSKQIVSWILAVSTLLLHHQTAYGLDVEVTDYWCDKSLYVSADFSVRCNGSHRCTFGEDQATITGFAHYKNVASSGIKYKIAYIMADIELVGLQYSLEEMRPVSLCNSVNAQSSNQYDCPGDGTYGFTLEYPIPNIGGTEKTSWLASGFGGTLSLKIYAEMDERMMVGLCYYNLETYVTQNPDSRFETPSAATVAGAVMGVIAVGVIIAVFYSCRRIRLRKKRIKTDKLLEHLTKDDITTIWKRLDDETRSIQSVFSKDADSSLASSPSLKFRPPTPTASKAGPTAEEATGDAEDPAPPKEGAEEPDRTPMWITAPDIKPESSKKKHRKKPQSDRSYPDEMAL